MISLVVGIVLLGMAFAHTMIFFSIQDVPHIRSADGNVIDGIVIAVLWIGGAGSLGYSVIKAIHNRRRRQRPEPTLVETPLPAKRIGNSAG
jgi:hypothetical protein